MKELKKIEQVVEHILETIEETRVNDDILYYYVCEYFNHNVSSMTLKNFLVARKNIGCPNFASVTRSRRKIFANRPDLKPNQVTQMRKEMEMTYIDYALS